MKLTAIIDESGNFDRPETVVVGGVLLPTELVDDIADAMVSSIADFDPGAPFILHHAWLTSLSFTVIARVAFGGEQPADLNFAASLQAVYEFLQRADSAGVAEVQTALRNGRWPQLDGNSACRRLDRYLRHKKQRMVDSGDQDPLLAAIADADEYRHRMQTAPLLAARYLLVDHPVFQSRLPIFAASESDLGNWNLQTLPPGRAEGADRYLTLLVAALERALDVAAQFGGTQLRTKVCTRRVADHSNENGWSHLKTRDVRACMKAATPAAVTAGGGRIISSRNVEVVDYPQPGARLDDPEIRDQIVLYLADAAVNRTRAALDGGRNLDLATVYQRIKASIEGSAPNSVDLHHDVERSHVAATFPARNRVLTGSWPAEGAWPMRMWAGEQAETW